MNPLALVEQISPTSAIGLLLGLALIGWGIIQQIRASAPPRPDSADEPTAELLAAAWINRGIFGAFIGLLAAGLIGFYGLDNQVVRLTLITGGVAILVLAIRFYRSFPGRPPGSYALGLGLELVFALYFIILILLT